MKKYTFIIVLIICFGFTATAQPFGPTSPTPFGLLEILIGAGAVLGGKKAYDANKMKGEE